MSCLLHGQGEDIFLKMAASMRLTVPSASLRPSLSLTRSPLLQRNNTKPGGLFRVGYCTPLLPLLCTLTVDLPSCNKEITDRAETTFTVLSDSLLGLRNPILVTDWRRLPVILWCIETESELIKEQRKFEHSLLSGSCLHFCLFWQPMNMAKISLSAVDNFNKLL